MDPLPPPANRDFAPDTARAPVLAARSAVQPPVRDDRAAVALPSRIEGLDGLRALSIVVVLIGHGARTAGRPDWLDSLKTVGVDGVELFFAISGFIITLLMVRERQSTGDLSLSRFWGRRALRILPPLAFMLLGFALASAAGIFTWSWRSFLGAVTFTRNLAIPGFDWGSDWFFGHTWSLSVEEQFYALWPLVFVAGFGHRGLTRGLLAVIAAGPIIALICEFHLGPVRNVLPFVPYLAVGCLLALLMHARPDALLRGLNALPYRRLILCVLIVAALIVSWLRNEHRTPYLWVPLDAVLMPAMIFLLLSETVLVRGALTRFLSLAPLRAIGVISYSLYLWQQLFFGPEEAYLRPWLWSTWPFNLVASLLCATVSYVLIERGSGRLKARLK